MIFYDVLQGAHPPSTLKNSAPHSGRILRALYDHRGAVSMLTAVHRPDGVHLILWGAPGHSIETVSDPRHHHVSRFTERVEEYAALFRTKTFIIETPRSPKFVTARLPTWTPVGFVKDGIYRVEYHLP